MQAVDDIASVSLMRWGVWRAQWCSSFLFDFLDQLCDSSSPNITTILLRGSVAAATRIVQIVFMQVRTRLIDDEIISNSGKQARAHQHCAPRRLLLPACFSSQQRLQHTA